MFKLNDGRSSFWQWDINQKLVVTELPIGTEVHFYHDNKSDLAFKELVEQDNGGRVCKVPNELLKHAGTIKVYGYVVENPNARTVDSPSKYTVGRMTFKVKPREKPVGYK